MSYLNYIFKGWAWDFLGNVVFSLVLSLFGTIPIACLIWLSDERKKTLRK